MRFLVALLLPVAVRGHWVCDNFPCPENAIVYSGDTFDEDENGNCQSGFHLSFNSRRIECASVCSIYKCSHFAANEKDCLVVGSEAHPRAKLYQRVPSDRPLHLVSKDKPVTGSAVEKDLPSSYRSQPNEVTNGVISQSQHFFHSASGDLSPWVVIDLINPYAVVKIDYLTRINDKVAFDRCRGITMYVGNELISDGDFSGYDAVATYNGDYGTSTSGANHWLYFNVSSPHCGRYFAVKKELTPESSDPILEITEIQLYTRNP